MTSITFGGVPVSNFTIVDNETITVVTPPHSAGLVDIVLSTPVASGTLPNGYLYQSPPIISSITPAIGSTAGGTNVTLTGNYFLDTINVSFDGIAASNVTIINSQTVTVTSPAHATGVVDVSLTTLSGSFTLANSFTYQDAPILNLVSPNVGSTTGGDTIILSGAHFNGTSTVTLGGVAVSFSILNDTTIQLTTPPHVQGAVDVSVTTPVSTVTLTNGFTYLATPTITSVSPAVGLTSGGYEVTLTGSDFLGATQVHFGGVAASNVVIINNNTATVIAPSHAIGTVDITMTNPVGTGTLSNGFTYTAAPVITNLSVTSGPLSGGTVLTITGNYLSGTTSVTFGNTPATNVVVLDDNHVSVTTPAHAAGAVDVTLSTSSGEDTVTNGFLYAQAPTLTQISPTIGTVAGGTLVTVTGTDLSNTTQLTFDGIAALNLTIINNTTVTAQTPAHAPATVDVAITTPSGSASLPNAYTYSAAPQVDSLSPSEGPIAGGTTVTLVGNFLGTTSSVSFGGNLATNLTILNDNTISVTTPSHAAGIVDVSVTTAIGTSQLSQSFTYIDLPTLTMISPTHGSDNGGTTVTLTGMHLTFTTQITFDGVPATNITVINDTTVTATTPAHASGSVDVTITTVGGTTTLVNGFTYDASPQLNSITPSQGPIAGGTMVTLSGSHFTGTTQVTFANLAASNINVVNDTTVIVQTPAHSAGDVDVTLTTNVGSSTLNQGFTYVDAPILESLQPTSGTTNGGTLVTLTGEFLTGTTGVTFNGVAATNITVINDTTVTVTTPAHAAATVDVTLTSAYGTSTLPMSYTFVAAPGLLSILPIEGTVAGGTTVTLTGTGLTGVTSVTFDGSAASNVMVVNATTITATTPTHVAGTVDVSVTSPFGSDTLPSAYTYLDAPILINIAPTTGTTAGNTTVTLTGIHLTGTTSVTFGGVAATNINVVDDSTVTVSSPAHSAGLVDVALTTPGGTSLLENGFTYAGPTEINSISPNIGTTAGGTNVTLTGSNFTGATSVTFDGIAATNLIIVNNTTVTVTTPAHAAGTVNVSITTPINTATLNNGYSYADSPILNTISPTFGTIDGGTTVTLTGNNFTHTTGVTFDGIAATNVNVVNDTTVTVTTPAHTVGLVNVVLTTPIGSSSLTNAYTYVTSPTLNNLTPTLGSVAGGTTVTLTGSSLTGTTSVTFDGIAATSVTVVNDTTVTCVTPAHAAGTVSVTLTTPINSATLTNSYTYANSPSLNDISPNIGDIAGGTSFTLSGNNLLGTTSVTLGGTPATSIAVINSTTITGVTAAHAAGVVDVVATNPIASATLTNGFTYTAVPHLDSCGYTSLAGWSCSGTNLNVFPTIFIHSFGGIGCGLVGGITTLTVTTKTATQLAGLTAPLLMANCTVSICANSTCSGVESNAVVFSGL